jgi:gliding motility-associated-like protein
VATTPPGIIYYVSQTITCESPRVPITVTVKPKPAPPTIPVPVIQVCQFEQAPPPAASGVQVRWFATPTGGVGSATAPTPNTLVSGTFYYYASQTVNGCESDRAIVTVIVKPKPAPPAVTSPLNLCQGDPIGPVSALGQNLLWYATPVGGIGVPVAPVPTTGYEDSFKYFVSQTVNGCESDRALMAVFVNYRPNGIITGTSPWVCQDEDLSFNYYGNARPDAQYAWYAPPGTKAVSGGTTQGPFVVHFDSAGTRVIRLTINNKGCISDLISAPITVRPLPVITYVNRQDVCEDELVTIALSSQTNNITGFNFNFGSDDAIVEYSAGTGGPFGVRYPKSGHYQVAATATANMCTSKPLIQDIYVHEQPDATITPGKSPIDICASDTLFLSVKPVSEGAVYTWTPGAYFQGKRDSLNNQVFAVVSQNSQVKVHIKTAFGCEATDSIKVTTKPCCGVFFPNAFAPTGNVVQNRMFRPITNGVHRVNSFRIVNRWGQVLYESKVERNGWDGTYNGVPQDMGTYYYYISYKCEGKDVEERGEFILLR